MRRAAALANLSVSDFFRALPRPVQERVNPVFSSVIDEK
jgi:hypothetical protein